MIDLSQYQELIFRQSKEMLEMFTDFETANRYRILAPTGEEIMYAYEESGMISRQFMGSSSPSQPPRSRYPEPTGPERQ